MKLTRGELKSIIKECFKELIKEGVFDGQLVSESSRSGRVSSTSKASNKTTTQTDPYAVERARAAARRMAGADDDEFVGLPPLSSNSGPVEEATIHNNPGLQNLVEQTARMMAKGDTQMAKDYAAIFADTAVNTLPQMMMNDPNRQGYGNLAAAGMQAQVEKVKPEELKSLAPTGDITRWATLAFGNGIPEKK